MKILLTINDISITGGAERVCVNLANALNECGHCIEVLSFYRGSENLPYTLHSNIELHFWHNIAESTFSKKMCKNIFSKLYYKNLYKFILNWRVYKRFKCFDIVICNDATFVPFFKHTHTKYFRILHLSFNTYSKRNNFFDSVILLTYRELNTWQKFHSNIKVIPNFLSTLPKISTNSEQKRVISVGRLSKEKGFLRLIDIWNLVQKNEAAKDWQLIIVGDGELKEQIESKILSLNLQDSITLKPFTKDIESQYLQASIYVMASHFEGLPMVLLESCSYGLCPVSFDIATGPSDIIDSGSSGYLVKDNDLQDFSEKILELMQDSQKRETFGKNAKQKVAESFSKEAVMKMWEEVLNARKN